MALLVAACCASSALILSRPFPAGGRRTFVTNGNGFSGNSRPVTLPTFVVEEHHEALPYWLDINVADALLVQEVKTPDGDPIAIAESTARTAKWSLSIAPWAVAPALGASAPPQQSPAAHAQR